MVTSRDVVSYGACCAQRAVAASLPMVIDADGIRVVLDRPDILAGSQWTVLTPNKPEYRRLVETFAKELAAGSSSAGSNVAETDELRALVRTLRGPTIVRKGPVDLISDGTVS